MSTRAADRVAALASVQRQPTGAAFDIVLLLHVTSAVLGVATVVVGAVAAIRLLVADPSSPLPATLRRYFSPGVNWAGRTLYAVPILGVTLLVMSRGAYGVEDTWVRWGIGLWAASVIGAESLLWPAERRIQALIHGSNPGVDDETRYRELRKAGWKMAVTSTVIVVALVAAAVVMVAQP
ncbi:MAG: hypothetical protein ACYDEP_11150 [Acidimicrobiales bacterium]